MACDARMSTYELVSTVRTNSLHSTCERSPQYVRTVSAVRMVFTVQSGLSSAYERYLLQRVQLLLELVVSGEELGSLSLCLDFCFGYNNE